MLLVDDAEALWDTVRVNVALLVPDDDCVTEAVRVGEGVVECDAVPVLLCDSVGAWDGLPLTDMDGLAELLELRVCVIVAA